MNNRILIATVAIVAGLSVPALSIADHKEHHDGKHKSAENLSPDLRALLQKEMKALQSGMISVVPAYISGNLTEVEEIATGMKNSFILKQAITKEQMQELHTSLPAAFVKMDMEFHYFAGMLAHAANRKKLELVNFYLSKLTESCVGCHSEYATHKFPGFSSPGHAKMGDHHEQHGDHQMQNGDDHDDHHEDHSEDGDDEDHEDH
jgi:hypothetical protein